MKIKFEKVTKKFGDFTALEDISFEIKQGEFVFITGKSGVGKSTVIKLILGEIFPTQGEVSVNDFSLAEIKKKKILEFRRQIGTIYQDFRLLSNKTVEENVLVALDIVKKSEADWAKKLEEVLKLSGLEERADFFPAQLSGGELQRTCLARALIMEPKIIIADEPTGNLDPEGGWQLMALLKEINQKGTTIIMATHNFDIVNSMKKRVIKLEKGKLISDKKKGEYE